MQRLSLINLDGMTGLAGLADRSGVDVRPTLLRVLTDLYLQKASHSEAEDRHYTELALRLIEVVDAATCDTVASRLARHPHPPKAVLERLARANSPATPHDKPGSIELFDGGMSLDDELFEPAAGTAAPSAHLAESAVVIASRPPIEHVDYVEQREAFFAADSAERRLILTCLEHVAEQDAAPAQETNLIRYLEQAALAGRAQEFTTLLQQGLGVSRALARRVVSDLQGEPFVVSARALAMPTDVFQRILMSLNPAIGQSVDTVFELSDLFAELPVTSAMHLVAIWRAADRMEARQLGYRTVYAGDAPLGARHDRAHGPQRIAQSPLMQGGGSRRESSGG